MKWFNIVITTRFQATQFLRYHLRNYWHYAHTMTIAFAFCHCLPDFSQPVCKGEWLWCDQNRNVRSWINRLCPLMPSFFVRRSFLFIYKYHYLKYDLHPLNYRCHSEIRWSLYPKCEALFFLTVGMPGNFVSKK